ncbi:unnamed protein product [Effrenium voratum]|nr:unnamed protein product [Effrenium voratum]
MPKVMHRAWSDWSDAERLQVEGWLARARHRNRKIEADNQELAGLVDEARELVLRRMPAGGAGRAARSLREERAALAKRICSSPARNRTPHRPLRLPKFNQVPSSQSPSSASSTRRSEAEVASKSAISVPLETFSDPCEKEKEVAVSPCESPRGQRSEERMISGTLQEVLAEVDTEIVGAACGSQGSARETVIEGTGAQDADEGVTQMLAEACGKMLASRERLSSMGSQAPSEGLEAQQMTQLMQGWQKDAECPSEGSLMRSASDLEVATRTDEGCVWGSAPEDLAAEDAARQAEFLAQGPAKEAEEVVRHAAQGAKKPKPSAQEPAEGDAQKQEVHVAEARSQKEEEDIEERKQATSTEAQEVEVEDGAAAAKTAASSVSAADLEERKQATSTQAQELEVEVEDGAVAAKEATLAVSAADKPEARKRILKRGSRQRARRHRKLKLKMVRLLLRLPHLPYLLLMRTRKRLLRRLVWRRMPWRRNRRRTMRRSRKCILLKPEARKRILKRGSRQRARRRPKLRLKMVLLLLSLPRLSYLLLMRMRKRPLRRLAWCGIVQVRRLPSKSRLLVSRSRCSRRQRRRNCKRARNQQQRKRPNCRSRSRSQQRKRQRGRMCMLPGPEDRMRSLKMWLRS